MAGPEIEFSEFMAARWAPLYRTAYLLTGDRHEAEDLLQTGVRHWITWESRRRDHDRRPRLGHEGHRRAGR